MTHRRVVTIAGIVGCIGALVTFLAWRSFARRLLVVAPVAADSIQRCPKIIDSSYARSIQKARPQILAVMREKRIPGMSVSVAVDGRIVWSEGFGFADVERRVPACPDTRFRIASVSKPVTAAVMAKLADEGRLDIDAPVSLYVPTFPNGDRITPRHLASHRSGIRHYRDDMEAYTKVQFSNLRESLALFQNDSLLFAPDTKHEYSSYGYALLGAALESASGQEFGALIERVVRPLGMPHTTIDRNDTTLADVTRFYDHVTPYVTDGKVHPAPFVAMSSKWAGGGMLSTTEDLVRFGSALLPHPRAPLLADSTRETLFTPRTRATPPIFGYALGWMTMRDIDLRQVYMHFGAGSGATSWLGIFPDQRVVVAVLANLGHAGFAYASTIGIGTRFMPKALPAIAIVLFTSFIAFALATYVAIKLAQLLSRSLRRPAA